MQTQQSAFTVRLAGFDETKKIVLIKELKSLIDGMNLVQVGYSTLSWYSNVLLGTVYLDLFFDPERKIVPNELNIDIGNIFR